MLMANPLCEQQLGIIIWHEQIDTVDSELQINRFSVSYTECQHGILF